MPALFATLATRVKKFAHWLRFNWMYLGSPPWDTGVSPPELMDFINRCPSGKVIDLGCGTGTNLLTLAKAGWQVTGVEFVPRAANAARRKLRQAGLQADVRTGDVALYENVQGTYDLALDVGCYHGLPEASRTQYRANLTKIIRPGGHFLIYAHWQLEDQPGHVGISDADFAAFQNILSLQNRQDSEDRWGRKATWMLFQADREAK